LIGLILVGMGLLAPDTRAPLSDGNVNLYCGLVMTAFGIFMLLLARRAAHKS